MIKAYPSGRSDFGGGQQAQPDAPCVAPKPGAQSLAAALEQRSGHTENHAAAAEAVYPDTETNA